jgi:tetratricopeptide (TPR) repeat protein
LLTNEIHWRRKEHSELIADELVRLGSTQMILEEIKEAFKAHMAVGHRKNCRASVVSKSRTDKKDKNERREELLRPSRYLGYDRDGLGMYLLSRGAYKIAESQFRRAIWLNPFEVRFVGHLAWCLYKQGSYKEAKNYIDQLNLKGEDIDEEIRTIIHLIKS